MRFSLSIGEIISSLLAIALLRGLVKGDVVSNRGFVTVAQDKSITTPQLAPETDSGNDGALFFPTDSDNPSTLEKRVFSAPASGRSFEWFRRQLRSATILPVVARDENPATALMWRNSNQAENFAVANLMGCTVVVIMSRNALYMAHFWETPSFEEKTTRTDRRGKPIYGFNQRRFDREVLDVLANGVEMPGGRRTRGVGTSAFTASGADAAAVILTPYAARGEDMEYPEQVGQIQDELRRLIPSMPRSNIVVRKYERAERLDRQVRILDEQIRDIEFTEGKILVRYDPREELDPDSCAEFAQSFQIIVGDQIRNPVTIRLSE